MKRIALLILSVAFNASAETAFFKDVRKPGGHERTAAARRADGRICGSANGRIATPKFPDFQKCMARRGWALDRLASDPAERAQARAADERARPWCYGAACDPDDSACMEDPSNTFSLCPDAP
jgi:hypothetical protein